MTKTLSKTLYRVLFPGWFSLILIFLIALISLGIVITLNVFGNIPIQYLTGDVTAVLEGKFYAGFLSQLGLFLWAVAASIPIFAAHTMGKKGWLALPKSRKFLLASGLISLWLGLDDTFLLHEEFFPYYIGIPEEFIYLVYISLAFAYLVRFRAVIIANTKFQLLVLAFVFFAVSILLDVVRPPGIHPFLFEDSAKFIGILSWTMYVTHAATSALCNVHTQWNTVKPCCLITSRSQEVG